MSDVFVTNPSEIGARNATPELQGAIGQGTMQIMTRLLSALAAALFLCCSTHAAGKQIRVALQLPKESHLYENLEYFKQLVETRANGAPEIVIAHSGQLIKEQDAPEAVATGAVAMASVTVNQYGSVIPAADLFVQPFLFAYPPVLAIATRPGSPVRAPIDQAILERVGARVLWWQSNGTTIMLSKEAPVTTPGAIAGKNVRVTTESEAELFRLCGGIPRITLPPRNGAPTRRARWLLDRTRSRSFQYASFGR